MEKLTQSKLIQYCENLGLKIEVKGNKKLFGSKLPDGWYIDNEQKLLLIFECKQKKEQWKEAKNQLKNYCKLSEKFAKSENLEICPVFCYGTETVSIYYIADFEKPFDLEFKELYPEKVKVKYIFNPHKFNQYIYDNFPTVSSDERLKIIVSVLLTKATTSNLNPPLFQRVLEVERANNMEEYFKFIVNDPFNKCVDNMFEFFANIPKEEILNVLYSCFVEVSRWSFKGVNGSQIRKNLTQNEGAVLTPPDIVELMVKELALNPTDKVCDPCAGTGNFLLEALKYTNFIQGNELDLTRSIVAKHGLIISGILSPNIEVVDCMRSNYNPNFDYLLLNPPYDHHKEQQIVLKFIKLSKKGGAVIIPTSNFKNVKFMEDINKICFPSKIINLNNKVFYPVASVQTSILIYSKNKTELKHYDFTNDGYEIQVQHGRIFKEKKEPILIKDTNITSPINVINLYTISFKREFEKKYYETLTKIEELDSTLDFSTWQRFIISDLFDYVKRGKCTISNTKDGEYPLISCSSSKNGVVKYIDNYEFDGVYLSISSNGDCGYCFVQTGKFSATQDVSILKPKHKYNLEDLEKISIIMSSQLNEKYNWGNKLGKEKLMNEIIYLPTDISNFELKHFIR